MEALDQLKEFAKLFKSKQKRLSKLFIDIHLRDNYRQSLLTINFSSCSKYIAGGSIAGSIILWEVSGREYSTHLNEHKGPIYSISFSPCGIWIASGSKDKTIKVWNIQTKKLEFTLFEHFDPVKSVAFSPNGQFIISGSYDRTIKIWNFSTKKVHKTMFIHSNPVYSVIFSQDGLNLASGTISHVKVWSLEKDIEIFCLSESKHHIISIDYSKDGSKIAYWRNDGILKICNVWDNSEKCLLTTDKAKISIAFSPNAKYISYCYSQAYLGQINEIIIWKVEENCLYQKISYPARLESIVFSPDNKYLATGSCDGDISIWNYKIRTEKYEFSDLSYIDTVLFSLDSKYIATISNKVKIVVWSLKNESKKFELLGHSSKINSLKFSKNSQFIISGSDDLSIKIWNIETECEYYNLSGHSKAVSCIDVSDKYIVSGSADKLVKVWELDCLGKKVTLSGHSDIIISIAISSNSKYIASISPDYNMQKFKLKLWNLKRLRKIYYEASEELITRHKISFLDDNKYLYYVSFFYEFIIWRIKDMKKFKICFLFQVEQYKSLLPSIDIDISIIRERNGKVIIWDFKSNLELYHLGNITASYTHLTLSPNKNFIAGIGKNYTLKIWDYQKELEIITANKLSDYLYPIAYSRDGKYGAYGKGKRIGIWYIEGNKEIVRIKGHLYWVRDLAFSSDNKFIVSGGDDNLVKIWDLAGNEIIRFIGHTDWVLYVKFSENTKYVMSKSYSKYLKIWCVKERSEIFNLKLIDNLSSSQPFVRNGKYVAVEFDYKIIKVYKPDSR